MLLYVILCYVMCLVLRISVPSLTVLFCASDNKRLGLELEILQSMKISYNR